VTDTVRQTLPPDLRIVCEKANGVLSNDAAMPLALILNELMTNAAKHGIKNNDRDAIRIGLTESDGRFELYVEDDGEGFDLEAVRHSSSGLRLVLGLARQVHGRFEVTRTPSRASLFFPAARNG
jgi:two-component sensor histidine kinase